MSGRTGQAQADPDREPEEGPARVPSQDSPWQDTVLMPPPEELLRMLTGEESEPSGTTVVIPPPGARAKPAASGPALADTEVIPSPPVPEQKKPDTAQRPKPDAGATRKPTGTRVVTSDDQPPQAKGRSGVTRVDPLVVLDRMGLLLQLQRRARTAEGEEIPFILVNESRQLLPYRQAALFTIRRGRPGLTAVSGLAVADKTSPYAQWLTKFVNWRLAKFPESGSLQRLDLSKLTAEIKNPPKWLFDWKEWAPPHVMWAPLTGQADRLSGILLFFRDEPFNESEAMFATHLTDSYGQSMALGQVKRFKSEKSRFPWLPVLVIAALGCMFIPIHQSILAPAEISARRPALVRSGMEGVVEQILVEPNQYVNEGDPLVRLDDTQLRTRLAVAQKAEDMAGSEYRQLLQAALSDPKSKQRIPLVQGRMEQLAAETAYIKSLMERIVIHSPMRGVALCDNPDEWLGRPVSLGQRIMLVADPEDLELEIRLPAAETLPVKPGDELMFFPNVAPISPVRAKISFVGYRAGEVPGVGMAYILRAELHESEGGGDKPLLGLRGMAKLYGPQTPLGLNLLRKPITAARQWLGW